MVGGWVFLYLQMRFSQNSFHHELLPHRKFQLSKFCIYGHKISQGYSIMINNLKCAGIFRKSVYFFLYGVRSWLLRFEYSEFSLMSSKKSTTRRTKNPLHVIRLQTVLKLARWQVADFAGLGTSRNESVRSEIQLLYSFTKYDYEKQISPSFKEFYKLSIDV